MRCKVVYYVGQRIDLDTKLTSGRVDISQNVLSVSGASSLTIPLRSTTAVELLRPHPRLSLMVKVVSGQTTVFLSALLFKFFGDTFVANQDFTIRLYDALRNRCGYGAASTEKPPV